MDKTDKKREQIGKALAETRRILDLQFQEKIDQTKDPEEKYRLAFKRWIAGTNALIETALALAKAGVYSKDELKKALETIRGQRQSQRAEMREGIIETFKDQPLAQKELLDLVEKLEKREQEIRAELGLK